MIKRYFAELMLLLLFVLLPGCTSILRSDMVTFHEGSLPKGETIRVEARDAAKTQSLEFRNYARLIGAKLDKLGYSFVDDPAAQTALIAQVDYSVTQGPTEVRLDPPMRPFVHYHFYYGRYYDPYYFGLDDEWPRDIVTTPNYLRNLSMIIVKNTEGKPHVFEGRVQSRGQQNMLPEVMPYLITALFTNFPGENGVTKVVTIDMDE